MNRKRALYLAAGLVVLAGLVGAVSCALRPGGAGRSRVVTIKGAKACSNLSRSWMIWTVGRVEGRPASLPARDGDLLMMDAESMKEGFFPYLETDGTSISVAAEKARLLVGGRTVSVELSRKEHCWDWLDKAPTEDLAHLRMRALSADVEPSRMPVIGRIAEAAPRTGLVLRTGANLRQVLPLFHPRQLLLMGSFSPGKSDLAIISSRKGLRVLWVDSKSVGSLAFVARLPDLRRLVLNHWAPEKTGPFPEGCGGLESLTIVESDVKDLSPIARLTGLRELHLVGCGSLTDIGALSGLPALESLTVFACGELSELSALKELGGITHLGLPAEITQEEFAAVVEALPGLRELDLIKCGKIKDLGSLTKLPKLRHLVALGSGADGYASLHGLKGLRYLALQEDVFKEQAEEIRKLEEARDGYWRSFRARC
ncbi:MAG: leucine-rich repeat domain-containing protein [Planctomycetota bacterium]|jgi:hypothetical protein